MYQFSEDYIDPDSKLPARFDVMTGNWKSINNQLITQSYGLILNEKDEVLIVHNSRNNTWQLPGGTVEKGESPKQCFIRETIEEANIILDPKSLEQLFFQKVLTQDDQTGKYNLVQVQVRYFARPKVINPWVKDLDETIDEIKWIKIKELPTWLKWGKTSELIVQLFEDKIG